MQAAIDAACEALGKGDFRPTAGLLDTVPGCSDWSQETHARLHLLKSALDFLPEPPPPVVDGKTPGQVCHESMYNTPEWKWLLAGDKAACESAASAVLAAFGRAEILRWKDAAQSIREEINKQQARAEKAEAELANWKEAAQVAKWQRDLIIDESTDKTGRILELEKLSTLRPISEAGDVPAGCVRYFFRILQCSFSIGTLEQGEDDTHFADILVLVESKIEAPTTEEFIHPGSFDPVAVTKPIHSTFTAHGKEWTRHMPGDPMPCDGEARICILDNNGNPSNERGDLYFPRTASINVWDRTSAWCYADEPSGKHTSEATITPEWTPAVGDVVTLKSGGPKMTVHQLFPEEDRVICYYFKRGILETPTFATATLTKAD